MPSERWTYGPAPARRKKTAIVRSRTGCQSCRTRRKKCDERKPVCTRCAGSDVDCRYGNDTVEFRHVNEWAEQQVKRVRGDRLNLESASSSPAPSSSKNARWAGQSLDLEPSLVEPARLLEGDFHADTSFRQTSSPSKNLQNRQESSTVLIAPLSTLHGSRNTYTTDSCHDESSTAAGTCEADRVGSNIQQDFIPPEGDRKLYDQPKVNGAATQGYIWSYYHEKPSCLRSEIESRSPPNRNPAVQLVQRRVLSQPGCLRGNICWQSVFPGNNEPCGAAKIILNSRKHVQTSLPPNLSYPGLTSSDHSYLSHFTSHVAQLLPTNRETIMSVVNGSYLARYAAMAISAANLANLRGRFIYDSPLQSCYSWIPDSRHRVRSLAYAGKALAIAADSRSANISTLLAAHLMLTFVELELGSFEGLRYYIASVDGLVYSTHNELLREQHGPEILRGLGDARVVQKFVTGPFGPPNRRESLMDQFWQSLESRMPIKSDLAQKVGCEMAITLERLCLLTTMQHHLDIPSRMQNIVMKQLSIYLNTVYPMGWDGQISTYQLASACQECLADMSGFTEQILSLPVPIGIPRVSHARHSLNSVAESQESAIITVQADEPLRFSSHRESMIAADYAWCRILCDESIILGITNPSGGHLSPVTPNARHWMRVLVRIARGLDISECSSQNIYRRGICGMLLHSAIRCGNVGTLDVLEDLLDLLISKGSAWEDCMFSNTPAVSTIRAVRSQLEQGRSILMMSSLDENANTKTTIMSNRMVRTLVLHGWEADGRTFDVTLHLDDFATALGA